jgi:alpha-ketoglutarate-dependent taurine dioxygenase
MRLESAKREALREARQAGIELLVVKDRAAEDPSQPYGYCPRVGRKLLYPLADVVGIACPNGEYVFVKGDA